MNSDKVSETPTSSSDASRDRYGAGQAECYLPSKPNDRSSASNELDRGTSLPDRPGAGNISFEGGSPAGNMGSEGGMEVGLSFQYALDNQKKLDSQMGEIQARNDAAEKDPKRAKA
jgi:hypothetical protein